MSSGSHWLAALGLGLGLLASPTAEAIDGSLPPPRTVAQAIPEAQVREAIARLDGLAEELMAETGLPGLAIAVVWRGEEVYARGFGQRALGESGAVDAGTVFQIASLSKPVAATVVARQVGKGVVDWDSKVSALLPGFALADPWVTAEVTLADLFSHRSGLPDHGGDRLEDMGYDRAAVLERLRHLPLLPFRTQEAYTNFGLTAAAEAVARASGSDWAELSATVIYEPLGMTATSSRHADYLARENRALGHIWDGQRFFRGPQRQPDAQSPAGGVSSTVRDFARWMIMVLGGGSFEGEEIVEAGALLAAITPKIVSRQPQTSDSRAGSYGYGFGVSVQPSGRVAISHSGAFYLGTGTNFVLLPSEELGIVAFSNATPIGAVEALTAQFMDLVQFGEISRDWLAAYRALFQPLLAPEGRLVGLTRPENPLPAAPLASYEGRYESDYFGPASVASGGEGLVLELGPQPQVHPLAHWSGDIFYFEDLNESAPLGSIAAVTFTLDATGAASSFTIDVLDEFGLGRFSRTEPSGEAGR